MFKDEKQIIENLDNNNIVYKYNASLRKITRISGGCCTFFCTPASEQQFILLLKFCMKEGIVFEIIGGSTNVYFCEGYNPQVVITTIKICNIIEANDHVISSCGVNLSKLSQYLVNKGIAGYEGFVGIPGTVGGAVVNNSGAFKSEMSGVVTSVKILTEDNQIKVLTNSQLKYSRRNSALKSGEIKGYILNVTMDTSKKEDVNDLRMKVADNKKYRKRLIDGKRKSLGSVFVSSSMHYLTERYRYRLLIKKVFYAPFRIFVKDSRKLNKINTWLFFFFLGIPRLAKHCDNFNRFCWDKETTEDDFFNYINTMQQLAENQLELEIELKG